MAAQSAKKEKLRKDATTLSRSRRKTHPESPRSHAERGKQDPTTLRESPRKLPPPKQNRLYVVFCHYNPECIRNKKPAALHADLTSAPLNGKTRANEIYRDIAYLYGLLKPYSGFHGFAFLFVDAGWTDLLEKLSAGGATRSRGLTRLVNEIGNLDRVLGGNLIKWGFADRIRFIAGDSFYQFLDELRKSELGDQCHHFLAGDGLSLYYDGPKIIEATIRIANLGRGIPIFRFDDDVLFYGVRKAWDKRGEVASADKRNAQRGLLALCRHYQCLAKDSSVGHFVFSGRYSGTEASRTADDFLQGFATRTMQLADLKNATVSVERCRFFFTELINLGANPYSQVISGAGLCLSDSAIVDLPPFSNMRQNVMWIDDHLKHALHHELGHFELDRPHSRYTRVDEASFDQLRFRKRKREPNRNNAIWHVRNYMIRLLLGCAVDAWLRADSQLKRTAPAIANREYFILARDVVPGIYAKKFQEALLSCWGSRQLSSRLKGEIRTALWKRAVHRMNEFVGALKDQEELQGTYLDLYIEGNRTYSQVSEVQDVLAPSFGGGLAKVVQRLDGSRPPRPFTGPLPPKEEDRNLRDALAALIDDFIDYIQLVILWKDFVQALRFLLNKDRERLTISWLLPGNRGCVGCSRRSCRDCDYPSA